MTGNTRFLVTWPPHTGRVDNRGGRSKAEAHAGVATCRLVPRSLREALVGRVEDGVGDVRRGRPRWPQRGGTVEVVRFATWNCHGGGLDRWAALEYHGVTLAVLCEAHRANPAPAETLFDPPLAWIANGTEGGRHRQSCTTSSPRGRPRGARWCVAACAETGPAVLGIYSNPERIGGPAKQTEVVACLRAWSDELARLRPVGRTDEEPLRPMQLDLLRDSCVILGFFVLDGAGTVGAVADE